VQSIKCNVQIININIINHIKPIVSYLLLKN